MYKNLAAALAAACFFLAFPRAPHKPTAEGRLRLCRAHHRRRLGAPARRRPQGRGGGAGGQVKTTFVENVAEGPGRRARDPRPGAAGPQADLHAQLRLHGADAEGGEGLSGREVRIDHRLQDAPNVATANARYYEGRYLAGIAAGRMTKTNVAGYVAGSRSPRCCKASTPSRWACARSTRRRR